MHNLEMGVGLMGADPGDRAGNHGLQPDWAPDRDSAGARVEPRPATRKRDRTGFRGWLTPALVGTAAALGASALWNLKKTRDAERTYQPIGRFLDVDRVRLHYIERGQGEPVVLIHGNGTMIQDF